jgi:hypothetical protein
MYKPETVPARTGKRLTCVGCEYSWVYLGTRRYIASCPRCHSSVTIESKREKTQQNIADQGTNNCEENLLSQTAPKKVGHPGGQSAIVRTKPPLVVVKKDDTAQ